MSGTCATSALTGWLRDRRSGLAGVVWGGAAVLLFTGAVVWLAGAPPWAALHHLWVGAFGSAGKFGRVLATWVPITLCACGLLFTFRVGLWNIGVEGQVIAGAVGGAWVLRLAGAGAPWLWWVGALLAGASAGALWAYLVGWLKARAGVNEIFGGLGLNFVAQGLVLWLIFGPWKRAGVASMSGTAPLPRELWLPTFDWGRVTPLGVALAVAALVLAAWVMRYSRFGLCFRAVGSNPRAAALFGVAPGRHLLLAMSLAGGLAGVAGVLQVAAVYHRLIPTISSNYGYLALLVVLVAHCRLGWLPAVALFFAALNVGSIQLPLALQMDSSLSGVIQGSVVVVALIVLARRREQHR